MTRRYQRLPTAILILMVEITVTSREVEVDGELSIEIAADGIVLLRLDWNPLFPVDRARPGWTCRPATGTAARLPASLREPVSWPWQGEQQRQLAQLENALWDYRRERGAGRGEMRLRWWERQARDLSAEAAAAWGRERLRTALGADISGDTGRPPV